jgi:Putative porin
MRIKSAMILYLCLTAFLFFCMSATDVTAKQQAREVARDTAAVDNDTKAAGDKTEGDKREEAKPASANVEDRLKAMEQIIERQQREIQSLRQAVEKKDPEMVNARSSESGILPVMAAASQTPASGKNEASPPETQKKVDELYKKFGAIRFSGDLRFRAEAFRNQGFDALAEAPGRNRLRVRARLALDGTINKHFDWGMRLASGIFTDPISSNQTLTDFYERKPFALDRAFVRYDSKTDKVGVQLIAGKFEPTFRRTQMVWDDDVNVEGASEALYFKTKSLLRQIKLVAFQLPFNEVTGGKDGVLYGGQAQTDWQFSPVVSANVNVGYYDWNHVDQVLLGLGALSTQVNGGITNGSGVTGNQNGSLGTTNRIIRNAAGTPVGFLAGFNLLDVLGNLTWQASSRYPVTFTFDFVRNLTDRVRDEKDGYWVGALVGQTRERGDWLVGYYYTRIEQDAVLVPFNFSDILASNSRVHMPTFAYQVANGVTLQWTGLFSQRVNKAVLLSPENRFLNRMQFDVIYKF